MADVVNFLRSQHHQIRALLQDVGATSGKAWLGLRRLLAVHETAEEEIVHPSARMKINNGDAIVKQRLQEEHEGKKLLVAMEDMDVDSPEFETALARLRGAVLDHAESEEREEFSPLGEALLTDQDLAVRMRKMTEAVEAIAPTRPHPAVGESPLANALTGPFIGMVDRARDMFKSYRASK